MGTIDEILQLEKRLEQAELGPDPSFFEEVLADDAVLDGRLLKSKVVEAHRPGKGPKFTRVTMTDMKVHDHGTAAVVTCRGTYEGPKVTATLTFMRVWVKKGERWQIVAGTTAKGE